MPVVYLDRMPSLWGEGVVITDVTSKYIECRDKSGQVYRVKQ